MKTIEPILIWTNGEEKEASILNAYASVVNLNTNATFNYFLFELSDDGNIGQQLRTGTLDMTNEEYALWNTDDVAWDFVASKLNLIITGDYVKPTLQTEETI